MTRADFQVESTPDGAELRLAGDWGATAPLRPVMRRLTAALDGAEPMTVRLEAVERFDTIGALVLMQASRGRISADMLHGRPEARRVYAMVERLEKDAAAPPRRAPLAARAFAKVGRGVEDIAAETMLSLAFLGRLIVAAAATLRRPGAIRWPAWVSHMERAGLDAIPIVATTSFFIGAVVAFIGADLLAQVGFNVFAVELVAISVLREFAVVIAAVLLAGRSASSFAAEIGAMKMNQEVDAMRVMGVDPFQALVIPRLAALVVMLPLLTFIAMISGLFGGFIVAWHELSLGPTFFVQRMVNINHIGNHLLVGLIKAPVFAVVVAAIGCRQGMSVSGDVESLGRRVTAAVVQAIFAIILLDAVFALIFLEVGL